MHRRGLAAVLAAAVCVASATLGFAPFASAEPRTVRVGVYENEPKVFTDENGEPSGIFIDLIEQIAEEEGWQLEYVPGTWSEGLRALRTGEIDLMPDVAYTTERDRQFDFHERPVVESWSYVYSARGKRIDRFSQLDGMRLAVLRDSVQESAVQEMAEGFELELTLVRVASLDEAFAAVEAGEADAAVANYLFGDYFYRDYDLEKTPVVFNAIPLYFAVTQGRNEDLLEAIDARLERWVQEPGSIYYRTLRHYTVADDDQTALRRALWVLACLGVLLGGAVGWILLLRWQVRVRTMRLEQAKEELEQHRVQLEAQVAERTAQLARANDRLAAASKSKSDFLTLMSHETRRDLNSVIRLSDSLAARAPGELEDETRRTAEAIKRAGTHLLRLVTNVLSLARIDAGGVDVRREPFDAAGLVRNIVDALSVQAAERGLSISAEVPARQVMIVSDERIVRQILLNLADNALKFTAEGFVVMALSDRGHQVALSVRDTGRGIDPGDIKDLFTEFRQGPHPIREEDRGAGLGLSIAAKMAALIDAELDVMSIPGRGSTFTLTLPSIVSTEARQGR